MHGPAAEFDVVFEPHAPILGPHARRSDDVLARAGVELTEGDYYTRYLGFDDVGVCSADLPMPDREHVAAAFDDGRMSPFSWMTDTRDQRLDVRVRMPTAKSVVVVVQTLLTSHV